MTNTNTKTAEARREILRLLSGQVGWTMSDRYLTAEIARYWGADVAEEAIGSLLDDGAIIFRLPDHVRGSGSLCLPV